MTSPKPDDTPIPLTDDLGDTDALLTPERDPITGASGAAAQQRAAKHISPTGRRPSTAAPRSRRPRWAVAAGVGVLALLVASVAFRLDASLGRAVGTDDRERAEGDHDSGCQTARPTRPTCGLRRRLSDHRRQRLHLGRVRRVRQRSPRAHRRHRHRPLRRREREQEHGHRTARGTSHGGVRGRWKDMHDAVGWRVSRRHRRESGPRRAVAQRRLCAQYERLRSSDSVRRKRHAEVRARRPTTAGAGVPAHHRYCRQFGR